MLDVFRSGANHWAEAASGDHPRLFAKFGEEQFENAIDQAEIAVVKAGLQAAYGVGADDARGLADLQARQACCAGKKSVGGDADAGGNHAAKVFSLRGNAVEGGGGAEGDKHPGAAVLRKR